MHRKSLGLSAVAVIGAILGPMGRFAAPAINRVTGNSKQGRRLNSHALKISRNTPHYGAKEQERAARLYMVHTFPPVPANDGSDNWVAYGRSAPTLCQRSKRAHALRLVK